MTSEPHHHQQPAGARFGVRLAVLAIFAALFTTTFAAPVPEPQVDIASTFRSGTAPSVTPEGSGVSGAAAAPTSSATLIYSAATTSGASAPSASSGRLSSFSGSRTSRMSSGLMPGYTLTTRTFTVKGASTTYMSTTTNTKYLPTAASNSDWDDAGNNRKTTHAWMIAIIVLAVLGVVVALAFGFVRQNAKHKYNRGPQSHLLPVRSNSPGMMPLMQSSSASTASGAGVRGVRVNRAAADGDADHDLPQYSETLGEAEIRVDTRNHPPAYASPIDGAHSYSWSMGARDHDSSHGGGGGGSGGGGGGGDSGGAKQQQ